MNFKNLLIICLLLLIPLEAKSNFVIKYKILNTLLDYDRFAAQDLEEPDNERKDRLEKLSISISNAIKKYLPRGFSELQMSAALMTIAYKETRLAKNVGIGRCDLMPKGQQCDNGKSKTYFQLQRAACPAIWEDTIIPGSQAELDIAAECAARLYTFAYRRCFNKNENGNYAGGFSGYASINCNWLPTNNEEQTPKSRAKFMELTINKLNRI